MKNIVKTFLAAVLLTGFVSCEDEQDLQYVRPAASFSIITPQSGEGVILSPEALNNPALVLAWEDMDYSSPTQVNYTVQVAANGTEFAEPVDVASTTNTFITINAEVLNNAADDAGLPPFTEGALDVRIKATVGTDAGQVAYSNVIVYLVTPFSTELPKLAVVGNHQGWNPTAEDVPLLASPGFGQSNYEGYVWLDGPFKILAPNAQGEFNWASQGGGTEYGGSAGMLQAGGGDITGTAAGYYLVKVDLELMTYSLTLTNWGVVGNATPGGWENSTPMTYDQTTRKWTITLPLVQQAAPDNGMKFRYNNQWTGNYGDNGADGMLEIDGTNIGVDASGNYTVTLDLSQPRAYTYSLQQN